ncbi:unnamed protein product, partial [Rangifer tarandus platyrhynchus]
KPMTGSSRPAGKFLSFAGGTAAAAPCWRRRAACTTCSNEGSRKRSIQPEVVLRIQAFTAHTAGAATSVASSSAILISTIKQQQQQQQRQQQQQQQQGQEMLFYCSRCTSSSTDSKSSVQEEHRAIA